MKSEAPLLLFRAPPDKDAAEYVGLPFYKYIDGKPSRKVGEIIAAEEHGDHVELQVRVDDADVRAELLGDLNLGTSCGSSFS